MMNMKKAACALAVALSALCAAGTDAFEAPPKESHPETWFHFIGGNVAKPGITADLEAIAGAGISGIHLFHGQFGGPWPGVSPQITCLSAPWDGLVGFVADECKRLGLRFTMQNCPGWAMSGGPWIKPENAMRRLSFGRAEFQGGRRVEAKIDKPNDAKQSWRDWRDVMTLAFPSPAGDWEKPLRPARVSANTKDDWVAWLDGKKVPVLQAGKTTEIVYEFDKPATVRAIEFGSINGMGHSWCYNPDTAVRLECDGKILVDRSLPAANWQDDRPVTMACDETIGGKFTLRITPGHNIHLGTVRLWSAARNDDWEAQAGWTLRNLMRNPARTQSRAAWIDGGTVLDVSAFMKPDGTLSWDAPPGKWTVLRIGHVNTGARNGPAPKEGTGYECDKMSTAAADIQFDNYVGRLSKAGGPVHGKIANMLMDSWECRRQTWTHGLDGIFREKSGYDIRRWMPALAGYVVDDPGTTARFLNDWREITGNLIADNFYGRMAQRCHERGMSITYETSFGDVIPGDILRFWKYADMPMCEFWHPRSEDRYVGSFDFKPVKPCVSAAHLYGKKSVAAEAFTSFNLTWDEKLRYLKTIANIHLAEGVSHMVLHTYTHNPRTDWLPPGTSFGSKIGTPFLRGQTWWKYMPGLTDWLARCQTMLEAGKPVRDVLWYLGDEWNNRPPHAAPFPAGHRYDYCNPDALLTRLSPDADGLWRTPDGTAYRVLWLPDCARMMPETLEKIAAGVRAGAVAAFARLPLEPSTLRGGAAGAQRFAKARSAIEALAAAGTGMVKGRIYIGRDIGEVLSAEKIAPDVSADGLLWNHRRAADCDWYFVTAADQDKPWRGKVDFRCDGIAEIWNPATGAKTAVEGVVRKSGRTVVPLSLEPGECVFAVIKKTPEASPFGTAGAPAPAAKRAGRQTAAVKPSGPWTVEFPAGWGMPEKMTVAELEPWKELGPTKEAKAFSGTAVYSAVFELPAEDAGSRCVLDMGRVESIAEVEVNGVAFRPVWSYPYKVDISGAVKPGTNTVKIKATGTWFNRLAYDAGQPAEKRRTWTIAGPPKNARLRDSGLLGPVEIKVSR